MFAKFCVVLVRFVVERHLMVSEPSFEFRGCKIYIGFGFAGKRHLGLVNDSFRETISFQGPRGIVPSSYSCMLFRLGLESVVPSS